MPEININRPDYWDNVYRQESASGTMLSAHYHRDYGPIHEAILKIIPDGSAVLDIACGPGLLCRKIRQRLPGTRVMGVDFADFMIEQNRERDHALNIEYRALDIRNGLKNLSPVFDVVMMCEIIEHLEEPEAVVAEAFDLLKSGGLFVLTCPHDDGIPDPEHLRTWGHDEIFHLLCKYSDTVSFVHFAPPYYHIWLMAYLTKTTPGPESVL